MFLTYISDGFTFGIWVGTCDLQLISLKSVINTDLISGHVAIEVLYWRSQTVYSGVGMNKII